MADYSPEQIYTAIRAADKAGDGAAVRALSAHLQTMQASPRKTIADRAAPAKPLSWMQRFGAGLADSLIGAEQLADHLLPNTSVAHRQGETAEQRGIVNKLQADQGRREAQRGDNAAREGRLSARGAGGFDVARIAGNLVSPANYIGGTGGASLGRMALSGAGAAAFQPVSGDDSAYGVNKLKQLAAGAAGGAVMHGLGKGISGTLAPKFSAGVKALMEKGVKLTPGQMFGGAVKTAEDKMESWPVIGAMIKDARGRTLHDWNRSVYDKVLAPLGIKYQGQEVGHAGVAKVEQVLSTGYNRLLPKLQFVADGHFVEDVRKILSHASELPPDQIKQLQAVISNRIAPRLGQRGQMDGQTFKQLESEIGHISAGYKGSADAGHREMANRLTDLTAAMRSSLERANPVYAPALKKLNASWAAFTRIQRAAVSAGSHEGMFTPANLMNAAKVMDRSGRKASFARGDALMQREAQQAQKILPSKVANSGTADRALFADMALGGVAAFTAHPLMAAGGAAATLPYTRPGMALLNAVARRPQHQATNALAQLVRKTATHSAVPASFAAQMGAQQLLAQGGQ